MIVRVFYYNYGGDAMASSTTTMEEKYRMIMECRQSGLTDRQWCEEHGIKVSTFYNWLSRFRRKEGYEVPPSLAPKVAGVKQDVVRISLLPEPEEAPAFPRQEIPPVETTPAIEIFMEDIKISVHNTVDTVLLAQTLRAVRGVL